MTANNIFKIICYKIGKIKHEKSTYLSHKLKPMSMSNIYFTSEMAIYWGIQNVRPNFSHIQQRLENSSSDFQTARKLTLMYP